LIPGTVSSVSISNFDNAKKIPNPVSGKNDPRVPYTETVQIVAELKKRGTRVVHPRQRRGPQFARKRNPDCQFYATVGFAKQTLLK
jgi:hypothetical protein